ncbi:SYNA protein, partial [Polypterus senegalus]
MCKKNMLLSILPPDWSGHCTLIQLHMPFYLLPLHSSESVRPGKSRKPRSTLEMFDSNVYIDGIGIPRRVPNQYKARDQVAAGFESIIFWWSTINKNVDWINYLYYNQQRFLNFTREAIEGIHGQLDKTSLMTWQNRIALDMLLAEKGGVCAMFGDNCCTFIPNNTAPDGSVSCALAGLTALSVELAENSGISNPLDELFERWFGIWAGWCKTIFTTVLISLAIMVICGCCLIPCMHGLLQRLIDNSLTKAYFPHADNSQNPDFNPLLSELSSSSEYAKIFPDDWV